MKNKNVTEKQQAKKGLGIERLKSGKYAIVDLDKPYMNFSKVLTKPEHDLYKATKELPDGVSVSVKHDVVAIVSSHKKAQSIVKGESRVYPDRDFGIFKSYGQAKKIKQMIKKVGN